MQAPGTAEYEVPSDFSGDDEEIEEDQAFTAEDNKKYGSWVAATGADGDQEASGAEEELGEGEYNTDDFSEVSGCLTEYVCAETSLLARLHHRSSPCRALQP